MGEFSLDEENRKEYEDKAKQYESFLPKEYLFKPDLPSQNIAGEKMQFDEVLESLPDKIKMAVNHGTMVHFGKIGASGYDYNNDILYIAKGATRHEMIHEIGHLVENKLMDSEKIAALRKKIVGKVNSSDISIDIYYNRAGESVQVLLLENKQFISEYQGRIYADGIYDAFLESDDFRDELLWEFISEPFVEFIESPDNLKKNHKAFYDVIKEAIE